MAKAEFIVHIPYLPLLLHAQDFLINWSLAISARTSELSWVPCPSLPPPGNTWYWKPTCGGLPRALCPSPPPKSHPPHPARGLPSLLTPHTPLVTNAPSHGQRSCLSKHKISPWCSFGKDKNSNYHFSAKLRLCTFIWKSFPKWNCFR